MISFLKGFCLRLLILVSFKTWWLSRMQKEMFWSRAAFLTEKKNLKGNKSNNGLTRFRKKIQSTFFSPQIVHPSFQECFLPFSCIQWHWIGMGAAKLQKGQTHHNGIIKLLTNDSQTIFQVLWRYTMALCEEYCRLKLNDCHYSLKMCAFHGRKKVVWVSKDWWWQNCHFFRVSVL